MKLEIWTYKDDFVKIVVVEDNDISRRRTRDFRLDASFLCDAGRPAGVGGVFIRESIRDSQRCKAVKVTTTCVFDFTPFTVEPDESWRKECSVNIKWEC